MGLFNWFGGKKKTAPDTSKPPFISKELGAAAPSVAETSKPAASAAALAPPGTGAAQVRLRLRLASSLRTGQTAAAYEAARGLADIQAKAGRPMAARMWTAKADQILAGDPKAA